jgi:hypothetical protein
VVDATQVLIPPRAISPSRYLQVTNIAQRKDPHENYIFNNNYNVLPFPENGFLAKWKI